MVCVCKSCHRNLQLGGALPLSVTGEFDAVSSDDASKILAGSAPGVDGEAAGPQCTWCGKSGNTVRKLLSRGDAHICNECVALCVDILSVELGDDWR